MIMKTVWLVIGLNKYSSGWLPDYTRVFARKDEAETHAEKLRNTYNTMQFVVNETRYVEGVKL